MILATLFQHPILLPANQTLVWLILPLCASVAIVYKTIRTQSLRRLPVEIALLLGYMAVGLVVLGVGLWLVQEYWP